MEERDHVLAVSGVVVSVEIETGLDCGLSDAVCTVGGRRLCNRMELRAAGVPATVEEPTPRPKKNAATGSPSIRGVARVGTTLRAGLSDLDGPDGLSGATFRDRAGKAEGVCAEEHPHPCHGRICSVQVIASARLK